MSKVIQVRDVPERVHEALTAAAAERGESLTAYLNAELAALADRPRFLRDNVEALRAVQHDVGAAGSVSRRRVLEALHAGRDKR